MRFGHQFGQAAIDNSDGKVSPRVLGKMGVEPPSASLVHRYLREIARTYNVDWGQDSDSVSSAESGGVATLEPPLEAELSGDSTRREPIAMAPPSPTSENLNPHIKLPPDTVPIRKSTIDSKSKPIEPKPQPPKSSASIADGIPKAPSLDELMARFDALKKR